ncbi:MAG: phytanoyl-CoA dioxygenase family protein [Planctomycetota bacterium]
MDNEPTAPSADRERTAHRFATDGYAALGELAHPCELDQLRQTFPTVAGATTVAERADIAAIASRRALEPLLERCLQAAQRCQTRPLRLAYAQWYAKPPGQSAASIPWHQDRAFWPASRPHTTTLWLALDHADEQNGCLRVLPTSHLANTIRPHRMNASMRSCAIDEAEAPLTVSLQLEAGHAVCYHERLVHSSGANQTTRPRRALVIGYYGTGFDKASNAPETPQRAGAAPPRRPPRTTGSS